MADIFDKIMSGVNKGVATVSTGSKNMIEKSKLYSIIKTLTDEKKQLLEILGTKVYNHALNNEGDIPRDEVEQICIEISNRIKQINELNVKVENLNSEMEKIVGTASVKTGLCSCGHQNKPDAKFCISCGKAL